MKRQAFIMDGQFYKRAKELLFQQSYTITNSSLTHKNLYAQPEFGQFFRTLLQRYIDAVDILGLIATTFIPNSSESPYKTDDLMRKLEFFTGGRQCCQNLQYFLDMEREVKRSREYFRRINESLAQLKYYQFTSLTHKYQLDIPEKIKRIINAMNVYQSFIIGVSAHQSIKKLEGGQLEAYSYYQRNKYSYTTNMATALASIIEYKEDLCTLKEELRSNLPLDYKEIKQNLETKDCIAIIKSFYTSKKQLQEIPGLLEKMIPYIEKMQEIPSKFTLAPLLYNQPIIDSFNSLCRAIRKLYTNIPNNNTSPSNAKFIYRGTQSPQRISYESYTLNYTDLVIFIQNIYLKLNKKFVGLTLSEKMGLIQQEVNNKDSYSASIIEQVTLFSQLLNPFIQDCLRYFYIQKNQCLNSSLSYDFSLRDLQDLRKAINHEINHHSNRQKESISRQQYESLKRISIQQSEQVKELVNFRDRITQIFFNLGFKINLLETETEIENSLNKKAEQIEAICNRIIKQVENSRQGNKKNEVYSGQFQVLGIQQDENDGKTEISAIVPQKNSEKLVKELKASQLELRKMQTEINKFQQQSRKARQIKVQLQDQIKALKSQISKKEQEISQLIQDQNQKRKENYQECLQKTRAQTQAQLEMYRCQISDLRSENESIYAQKLRLQNELQQLVHLKAGEQKDLKNTYELELNQLKKSNAKNNQQIQILTNQLSKIQQLNRCLKQQNQMLKENTEEVKQRYTERITEDLNRTINSISKVNSMLQNNDILTQLQEGEPQSNSSKKEIQILMEQYKKQSSQLISQLQKAEKNLQSEVSTLKEQLTIKMELIQTGKSENEALRSQLHSKNKQNEQLVQQIQLKKRRIDELEALVEKLKKQLTYSSQNKQDPDLYCSPVRISSLPPLVPFTHLLFNHDIFRSDNMHKERLLSHLESYTSSRVKATNLVYKFDPRNKTNFHLYLDQIKNLALVIRTNSAIIAGFYPGVYREKEIMDKGGLLVSVTNNQSYQLIKNNVRKVIYRGMIYDSYFVIFGNAEIRVRMGYKTVFSNFGVNNSFFDSRGHKIDAFLNEGEKRQVEFQNLECYEVIFEDDLCFRQSV